jgi:hypothetical protein
MFPLCCDATYAPEESFSSNVTNTWMRVEGLVQQIAKNDTKACNVGNKILLSDDSLHLECSGAGDWMALICMAMSKGPEEWSANLYDVYRPLLTQCPLIMHLRPCG